MKHLFGAILGITGISLPAGAQQEITISNTSEFISSIGSDRRILVKPGTYNLTEEINQMLDDGDLPYLGEYYTLDEVEWEGAGLCRVFDGLELLLANISNLTITAFDKSEMPHFIVEPRYAFVMRFRGGSNIRIEGLTMGHTEGGYCEGGVLGFDQTECVAVSGCDLYGCGMEGINAVNVNGLYVDHCTIRDCSYQIMTVEGCNSVMFKNCRFLRNSEYSLVNVSNSEVEFMSSIFSRNEGPLFNVSDSRVSLNYCVIAHDRDNMGDTRMVNFQGCSFFEEDEADDFVSQFAPDSPSEPDSELDSQYPCVGRIMMQYDSGLALNGRFKVGRNGGSTIERLVKAFCLHYPGNITYKSLFPTDGVKVTLDSRAGYFHSDTDPSGKTNDGLEMCYWKMETGRNIVAARLNYNFGGEPCVLLMFYRYEPGTDTLVPLAMEGPDSWQMEEIFPATLFDGATVELPRQGKDITFKVEADAPVRTAKWANGYFK